MRLAFTSKHCCACRLLVLLVWETICILHQHQMKILIKVFFSWCTALMRFSPEPKWRVAQNISFITVAVFSFHVKCQRVVKSRKSYYVSYARGMLVQLLNKMIRKSKCIPSSVTHSQSKKRRALGRINNTVNSGKIGEPSAWRTCQCWFSFTEAHSAHKQECQSKL